MYVYMCCECGRTVKSDESPSSNGCSAGSSHSWYKLEEAGDTGYSCSHCGKTVYVSSSPSSNGCPAYRRTGYNSHSWNRL